MWIFTKQGFISIKEYRDDSDKLLVRARVEGDLERIFPGCKVAADAGTDYKYRATIDRHEVARKIYEDIARIDYTQGFKTSVDDHKRRGPFYLRIWETLCDMQDTLELLPG